jgi:hypothetical protein
VIPGKSTPAGRLRCPECKAIIDADHDERGDRREPSARVAKSNPTERAVGPGFWIGLATFVVIGTAVLIVLLIWFLRWVQFEKPSDIGEVYGGQPGPAAAMPLPALVGDVNQTKTIATAAEWNREVFVRVGGDFAIEVSSQGPFALSIVSAEQFKASPDKRRAAFKKEQTLLTADSKQPTYRGNVTLPATTSYVIIENLAGKQVNVHLRITPDVNANRGAGGSSSL